jgi:uncharacterized protein YndB with AHSA1/START domain
MSKGFEAIKTVTIDAPRDRVWNALTDPKMVKQYMHGTNMSTDWREGSPIKWKGEWKGKPYEDKGTVLAFEPKKLLRYTHWSPMGGSEDKPENYHTVTYELSARMARPPLLSLKTTTPLKKRPTRWRKTTGDQCWTVSSRRRRSRPSPKSDYPGGAVRVLSRRQLRPASSRSTTGTTSAAWNAPTKVLA